MQLSNLHARKSKIWKIRYLSITFQLYKLTPVHFPNFSTSAVIFLISRDPLRYLVFSLRLSVSFTLNLNFKHDNRINYLANVSFERIQRRFMIVVHRERPTFERKTRTWRHHRCRNDLNALKWGQFQGTANRTGSRTCFFRALPHQKGTIISRAPKARAKKILVFATWNVLKIVKFCPKSCPKTLSRISYVFFSEGSKFVSPNSYVFFSGISKSLSPNSYVFFFGIPKFESEFVSAPPPLLLFYDHALRLWRAQ